MFNKLLSDLLTGVSQFGNNPVFVLFAICVTALILAHKKWYKDLVFLFLSALSYPYSLFLKETFKIENPARIGMRMYFEGDKYTFPSSHVIFYTVFFGYILFITFYKARGISQQTENTLRYLSVFMIAFIGFSRVFLGFHTVTDVLAGYFFGGIYLALVITVRLLESSKKKING